MRLGRTKSVTLHGLDGRLVDVEAHISSGLPRFALTGLPDQACAQSPNRVRSAALSTGFPLTNRRITVNLAPSAVPKHGSAFDLPIAIAVLAAQGVVPDQHIRRVVYLGELGLDGAIRAVPGILPAVLAAVRDGIRHVVVPLENLREARLVDGITVHAAADLKTLVTAHRSGGLEHLPDTLTARRVDPPAPARLDMADVIGQHEARAAVEYAAAGGHHLLLSGPPGAGKTMLAERLVTVLPRLTGTESLQTLAVRSLLGELPSEVTLDDTPPFVAPHHSATIAALVGGGSGMVRPGAISRAHHGVLFLDEAPEFGAGVLQALRQPLESGRVTIARSRTVISYPASFQLVLASNPCPCGMAYGKGLDCTCTPRERRRYAAKLSGPLLDRIDLQVAVRPVTRRSLSSEPGESSAVVRERVIAARERQARRWAGCPWRVNGQARGPALRRGEWRLPSVCTAPIDRALDVGRLTLRGYDRVLRLAWTIADLHGRDRPTVQDVGIALTFRQNPMAVAA